MSQSVIGAVIGLPAKASVYDQSVAYSPAYLYQLYPVSALDLGEATPVAPDYQVVQTDSLNYHSNATFTMTVRRGTQVTASTAYDRTHFRGALSEQPQLGVHSFSGGVVEHISRSVLFSVDYSSSKWFSTRRRGRAQCGPRSRIFPRVREAYEPRFVDT
jgi:hypothetical protein